MSKVNRVKHLRKGDTVVLWRADSNKRPTGKVVDIDHDRLRVRVEGVGVTQKHQKPTQQNPQGGVVEGLRWWPASRFRVCDSAGKPLGRAGSKGEGKKKERVFSKSR